MDRTDQKVDRPVTEPSSGPVRYELIDKDGKIAGNKWGPFRYTTAQAAANDAKILWPDQEQDEDRAGKGWDVQVVGCER